MTRNSLVWFPILLQRKIPVAWGTTTDKVTAEINPFPYAKTIEERHKVPVDNRILGSLEKLKTHWLGPITKRNSYGLGYHNRQLDLKNQSFPICKRNQIYNTKGS